MALHKHETDMLFVTGEHTARTSLLPGCKLCRLEQAKLPCWIVSCILLDCRQPQEAVSHNVFSQCHLTNLVETLSG